MSTHKPGLQTTEDTASVFIEHSLLTVEGTLLASRSKRDFLLLDVSWSVKSVTRSYSKSEESKVREGSSCSGRNWRLNSNVPPPVRNTTGSTHLGVTARPGLESPTHRRHLLCFLVIL